MKTSSCTDPGKFASIAFRASGAAFFGCADIITFLTATGATGGTWVGSPNLPRAYPPAARRSPPKTTGAEGPEGGGGGRAGVWVAVRVAKDWEMDVAGREKWEGEKVENR